MRLRTLLLAGAAFAWATSSAPIAPAADLQSFEFNESGAVLSAAGNTASVGNQWVEDINMLPSDTRNGAYQIVKGSSALDNNYLQIDNFTSGTRYLVARFSGWNFGDTIDAENLEEVRFAFLNDDDTDFGSTVTAQMQIRRLADGSVTLLGDALGTGASNIAATASFADDRTTPFTMALELNKSANTYRVFYKDDSNPTQVLGPASVASNRIGASLRLSANNSFGEGNDDYPVVPAIEVASVDRIALTDTNPFTDLITLDVDRVSGAMALRNTSGTALTGLQSYSITSSTGPFDPTKWKTVTGNYDSSGIGNVDNSPWTVTSATKSLLSEAFQSGDGGGLTLNQSVELSLGTPPSGTWLRSPFEDVSMVLNFASGPRTVNVNYTGNGGLAYVTGDLNFDNEITAADYVLLSQNAETSLVGLSQVEAYRRGDLDGDGVNSIRDFIQFKGIYELANPGSGSFVRMLATIPEPSSLMLLSLAAGVVTLGRRRRYDSAADSSPAITQKPLGLQPIRETAMPRCCNLMCLVVAIIALAPAARAGILEDFPFSDANTTLLEDAENAVNSGNNWLAHANTVESSVFNGSYRINKQSQSSQATNVLEIANIASGRAWLVAEIPAWNFSATPSSPSERVRFGFLDNDMPTTGSSTVTAEMTIDRNTAGDGLILSGEALTIAGGASPIASDYNMNRVRTTPLTIALELNKVNDTYSVYYREGAAAWGTIGSGNLGTSTLNTGDRDGNSLRFAFTGSFGDTDEFFDVSRIYLTDVDPLGGPIEPVALSLEVKSNGQMSIINTTDEPITFDSYRITSSTNALNFNDWTPLSGQGLDEVDGGDDPGETWTISDGSSDGVLAESFLLGASTIGADGFLPLGSAFQAGGDHNSIVFQYHDEVTGVLVTGDVEFVPVAGVPGDYNGNNVVDAADYTIWRDRFGQNFALTNEKPGAATPGFVDAEDYAYWKSQFGSHAGSGGSAKLPAIPVPEPNSLALALLLGVGGTFMLPRARSRPNRRNQSGRR